MSNLSYVALKEFRNVFPLNASICINKLIKALQTLLMEHIIFIGHIAN